MRYTMGIDLGSTTTKAVLMDEHDNIVGRGLTNTRSNYHVATEVARTEALISARFLRLREVLSEGFAGGSDLEMTLDRLHRAFRLVQYNENLKLLHDTILREADGNGADANLEGLVDGIFTELEKRARKEHMLGTIDTSRFFRDVAGAAFMTLAEDRCKEHGVAFDRIMALYDRSIILVENTPSEAPFETTVRMAADRAWRGEAGSDNHMREQITEAVAEVAQSDFEPWNTVGTGYGRQRLPFRKDQIRSEILCHGFGAHYFFPNTATVLDIGGQDTKAIQVDDQGLVTSFQMNDRCAAGCGRYLGYIADELNISVQELGPMAQNSSCPSQITSTCTVFAGAELRDRLSLGEAREDVVMGLHRAIILRAMSLLARSGGVDEEFTFTGGVARNPAVVDALQELIEENYGTRTLNIHPDSIYTGAVGAALFAQQGAQEVAA
jgi:benzoyl-CoA reductase subunit A